MKMVNPFDQRFSWTNLTYINHSLSKGWVDTEDNVYQQDKGPMMVIFGAFVVWRDQHDNVQGGFVEDHIINWPADGGNRLQEGVKKGRPFKDKEKWLSAVPPEILASKTVPQTHDYHGHFNSDIFEILFTCLCDKLNELGRRNCIIHMDGASYHVRSNDRAPTKSATKEAMIAWLKAQIQRKEERPTATEANTTMTTPKTMKEISSLRQ